MKKFRKILLFLKLPPPYGGGEIINQIIYEGFKNEDRFSIFIIKSGKHSNKSTQGRLQIYNIVHGINFLLKAAYAIVITRPEKIYISIPKNFISFFRNSLLILFCGILGVKVYGDLAGMSFPFISKRGTIVRKYSLFIFSKIDSLRILGQNIKKYIPYFEPDRLEIFPNGIEFPKEAGDNINRFLLDKLKLLYVGSIESSKGFKQLIQTVCLCNKKQLNVELNVLGEWTSEEFKKEIERTIIDEQIRSNVIFHGLSIDEKKWNVFRECAILIHPTKWDGQPVSILEAMSLGLVIITTNVGAIPDTIENGKNGIILDEADPDKLFNAIEYYYMHRQVLANTSNENIKYFKENYSKEIFIKNFSNWLQY